MKKIVLIILAVLLLGGGGVGGYFYYQSKQEAKEVTKKKEEKSKKEVWNPYAEEAHHQKVLNDFLVSAAKGEFVVKMTVTLDLKDKDAVEKFEGLAHASNPEEEAEAGGHGAATTEEKHLTPMEVKINSLVGNFMLEQEGGALSNKASLEENLKTYLNEKLGLEEDFIKKVYIENYIAQ